MSDDANRTERGRPPAPFGTEDTLAAPVSSAGEAPATPTPPRWVPPDATRGDSPSAPPPSTSSASLSLPAIDRVRYQLEGEVGRGGLGRVSKARDVYLDRRVAIKELIDAAEPSQKRFVREALITARLQHPAIVPIYDAGISGAQGPFYTMKLVAGKSLADALAGTTTLDQRLALLPSVIAVVDAMAYAHSARIIHRDLKPQNVLVGEYGETVLIDWGLAKDLAVDEAESAGPYREAQSTTETLAGAVMGTPAFMAPEQATGGDPVDERSDVYALGAMLYYLGAGVPPHAGKSVDEMLVKVVAGEITPLHEREPNIPVDLAAIVSKAMAHDPAKRYPSAREMAEDLRRFQTGKLVGAKTYTRGERLRRWLRKNRALVAVAGIALAILLVYGGWSVSQIYAARGRAEHEAELAVAAQREAEVQRDNAIAQAMLVRARQYAATGHAAEELAVLRVLARQGATARKLAVDEGGLVWKSHQRLAMALGHDVGLVARSADGSRFVASEPGALVVWDAATGRELVRHAVDSSPTAARFGTLAAISPTARYAAIATCAKPPCGISIAGDDTFQLPAGTKLEVIELMTGAVVATFADEPLHRRSLAFAADDSAIAVRHGDRVEVAGGDRTFDAKGCDGPLAIAPAGAHVAFGCKGVVKLDGTREILRGTTTTLHFIGNDRLVAIGDELRLWDLARGELRGSAKLPESGEPTARDEGDELDWSYLRPQARPTTPPKHASTTTQIRIGSSLAIVARTSLLAPAPRPLADGAVVTLEGPDWQALVVSHDRVHYALLDRLVPPEPPERCLPRIGGERHAALALDDGARVLVDAQELAAGLDAAPAEGYRHTTSGELPVRQLRPLVAAESDTCLVWGQAIGAHALDAGALPPGAHVVDDRDGGLIALDAYGAVHIDRAGTHTQLATKEQPIESADGRHVASIDPDSGALAILASTGAVERTYAAKPDADLRWAAIDVVEAGAELVPVDGKLAVRKADADLVTEPLSRYGVRRAGDTAIVVRVADGSELARHARALAATDTIRPLPDDSGAIVVSHASGAHEVIARSGARVALAATRQFRLGRLEVAEGHLVSRTDDSVAVWNLGSGRAFTIPVGARDAAIAGGTLYAITGQRRPRLVRVQLDGKRTRETRLATPGLPFVEVRGELVVSPDGVRIAATYAVTEELTARALWDADTGTLLWIGPPAARVVGNWLVAGGHAYVPSFDVDRLLVDTGARTNLRVCKEDLRAVPVSPPPAADTYWAPDSACGGPR